jgi:GT2 family glycosyltransferase
MKISWLLLTFNRAKIVCEAIPHCIKNAGLQADEMIWVDNGSSVEDVFDIENMLSKKFHGPVTKVMIPKNLGVAKGYNTAMALARGTHMVITGCDMLMPDNWLKDMANAIQKVPNTGIVTIYTNSIDNLPERKRGEKETINGINIQKAMPIGRRMLSAELQRKIGYFHEGFGFYGWDDVAWGHTAERVCDDNKLLYYNLYDRLAVHLGTEGNLGYDNKDQRAYWEWKKKEVEAPEKLALMNELKANGYPSFTPY